MKPCPACKSEIVSTNEHPLIGYWARCSECHMTGPTNKTESDAIAAWDAMPRKAEAPADTSLKLTVGDIEYSVNFTHMGPVTFCGITWHDAYRGRQAGIYGASFCNPKDAFDPAIGEKIAMRKTCGVGQRVMFDLTHVYSAYRKLLRDQRLAARLRKTKYSLSR